jgi:hypothetical protein
MQELGRPIDHTASPVNLAMLDRHVDTKGSTDDLAQRLGAVDNEQPAGSEAVDLDDQQFLTPLGRG